MGTTNGFVDAALRTWNQNVERAEKFFTTRTDEQLQQEIAPGKNRLIYLWGHLAAVNDRLIELLGLGQRLHPELDAIFLEEKDRAVPHTYTNAEIKRIWDEVNAVLNTAFAKLTAEEWLARHTAVSEEDFAKEPHRNRYNVLLSRTGHLAYHLGQAILTKK